MDVAGTVTPYWTSSMLMIVLQGSWDLFSSNFSMAEALLVTKT